MRRLIAFVLVCGIAVAACSSTSGSRSASLDDTRASAKSTTTPTIAPFASAITHTPGTLGHFVGARADVHDTTCMLDHASWNAEGEVTNPTRGPVNYRIYVSFLRGDTTIGLAETNLSRVAPHTTRRWAASSRTTARDLRCILRVERAAA